MKFNWGTGIALAYITFALFMIGLVMKSRSYDPGLVQTDYYNLDLNYQARLNQKQNTSQMAVQPDVQFDRVAHTVEMSLPEDMAGASGTAKCYRSATTGEDFTVEFDHNNKLSIPAAHMTPGRWHVELDWESGGKKYFYETTFIVTNA